MCSDRPMASNTCSRSLCPKPLSQSQNSRKNPPVKTPPVLAPQFHISLGGGSTPQWGKGSTSPWLLRRLSTNAERSPRSPGKEQLSFILWASGLSLLVGVMVLPRLCPTAVAQVAWSKGLFSFYGETP